jgi:hypothetical protein
MNQSIMHMCYEHDQVSTGDYFSAGGWSGKITRIFHDDLQQKIDTAKAGWGVRIHVSLNRSASDPRPLGDEVRFFSPSSSKRPETNVPTKKSEKKSGRVSAEDEAEEDADQNRMEYSLSKY